MRLEQLGRTVAVAPVLGYLRAVMQWVIWLSAAGIAGSTVGLLAMMLRLGNAGRPANGVAVPSREEMRRFVLWHAFYVNPDDPRGWVSKTTGIGYTVNFRTRDNALRFALWILLDLLAALAMTIAATAM
jgi:uncharacterized membrane protein